MTEYITPIQRLIEQFRKLPGIGTKSAVRMAFSVLNWQGEEINEFADVLMSVKNEIHTCPVCNNLCDGERCEICSDESRDGSVICVVENPRDIMAIERIRDFKGLYHVLGGVLSPTSGIGPDCLNIKDLMTRLVSDSVKEIILATNPSVEGEATAMYLAKLIKPFGIKCSRLAYGIPVGGDLEYADEFTLRRAIEGRNTL